MKFKIAVLFLIFGLLLGCSEPKVDASSDEAMKSSIAKVRESLPEVKRPEFDQAIQLMAFSQINMKDLFTSGAAGVGNFEGKMRDVINGKTGNQIIAEANQIKIEREKKQKEQALQEIIELEEKKKLSIAALEQLKQFEVLRSRFYKRKKDFMGDQPIIDLTVKNNTSHAVSRAYFEGTIASPGRSVPWHQDTFNYSISGGLEPLEEGSWSLAPNMFSDWGKVEAPSDAIFTVTVTRIDGADGNPLYSTDQFGEREERRLAELKEKYGIQQ
ncbi:DUF6694 family lipoprotein [Desulfobacula sp.]|uniref:DUF6694 family lipoprotein n=1 Tax=Desulfobacula sp. TaxID=2593537 RepID=UPI0026269CE8|nr:DUF6694 family lipoprotein [Desulfobacula sp.]